jgi:hypothetical protein
MGGFCGKRVGCPHYEVTGKARHVEPSERMCVKGADGVRIYRTHETSAPAAVTQDQPSADKEGDRSMTQNTMDRLVALLEAHPMGIASCDAAKILGVRAKTICARSNLLVAEKKVAVFRQRFSSFIVPIANAAQVRAEMLEQMSRKAKEHAAIRAERDKARGRREWDKHEAWAERQPVHRVIDARKARPLGKVGRSSVFEVAA